MLEALDFSQNYPKIDAWESLPRSEYFDCECAVKIR